MFKEAIKETLKKEIYNYIKKKEIQGIVDVYTSSITDALKIDVISIEKRDEFFICLDELTQERKIRHYHVYKGFYAYKIIEEKTCSEKR